MASFKHKYGLEFEQQVPDHLVEGYCFLTGRTLEEEGIGRFGHFLNYANAIWPNLEWNPWMREQCMYLCDDDTAVVRGDVRIKTVCMTGCGGAGKSFVGGMFASAWWRVAPDETAVILCSTTKEGLRKRIWSHIPAFWGDAIDPTTGQPDRVGHLIESRTKLLFAGEKGQTRNDKYGIWGLAVREGETQKAVMHIKGTHARRIMVVVDEAEATPEAIFEAISNLRKGCTELFIMVLGNSVSHLDPHGICCEPAAGWKSITVDSTIWPTKGVSRWQIEPGICLHFDGTKSPNVTDRRTKWPYLYSWEDHTKALESPDYQETMRYWQYDRGFWPIEGVSDCIFTEQLIEKYEGRGKFQFITIPQNIAFLDSAFGGDDCKLVFGLMGEIEPLKFGIEIVDDMIIPIKATSPDEIDYQIARTVIEQCKRRGIAPEGFGVDATGIGRGVAAIISGEWSPNIHRYEGSGKPTDRPSSTADGRPSNEVFDRFSSEVWWMGREVLQAGQLRGLYNAAVVQLCSRKYEVKSKKHVIETKVDFKARLGRSPDDADAVLGLVEVARRNGLSVVNSVISKREISFDKFLRDSDDMHEESSNVEEFNLEEAV